MFVRRSVRPLRGCEKIYTKTKNISKKKVTNSLLFTYAWGRPYPTDCNGSSYIYLGYRRYQSCQFWWLLVEEFGFCEESNLGFSYRKLTHMALNYNTALRYRAGMCLMWRMSNSGPMVMGVNFFICKFDGVEALSYTSVPASLRPTLPQRWWSPDTRTAWVKINVYECDAATGNNACR
jgi:hypothetical protein